MIGWTWLVATFGPRDARRVAIGGGIILALVVIVGGLVLWLNRHDDRVIEQHAAQQQAAARPADAAAADDRLSTTQTIANETQEVKHAVDKLPDAPLTDRQRARACAVFLRQHPGANPPAACRPETGR
ncbi:hypothetical protein [Sphingomonas elodea]|uniref:hypothetical protein n=1 Tax=Sphingomonas elodea TaxID=179878 RepID=UPI0002631E25|nr:hypothetical protein [Sphingomonas elodea]